eukprot:NODE_121_length_17861_cov_0.498480.p13 type:complete len:150 gc:universal NODE_121_length_17861_cov_0.498480:10688-11137(+)
MRSFGCWVQPLMIISKIEPSISFAEYGRIPCPTAFSISLEPISFHGIVFVQISPSTIENENTSPANGKSFRDCKCSGEISQYSGALHWSVPVILLFPRDDILEEFVNLAIPRSIIRGRNNLSSMTLLDFISLCAIPLACIYAKPRAIPS